jgi:saccharopine dehydrogenase (NAD+, L-lysine-forming)
VSADAPWVLVGATGASGRLILQEALARGHRPVLAGRNQQALTRLADVHGGLPTLVLDLADPTATARALTAAPLVLNTAGPFSATARALAEAAIGNGGAYLDLSNEPPVTRALIALDDRAHRSGALLLPGVGFGVVVADCLAAHLIRALPDATSLTLALEPHVGGMTPALAQTSLELVAAGATTIRDGREVNRATGRHSVRVPLQTGSRRVPASVTADVLAVHRTTGVPNIDVLTTEVPGGALARLALPTLSRAMRLSVLRGAAVKAMQISSKPLSTDGRSSAWGRAVRAGDGREVQARLDLQDGYVFTAASAVRAVEEALAQDRHHGYRTPSQVFGADFITTVADTALSTA